MWLLAVSLAVLTARAHGEICPCRPRMECPGHYGTRPLDVLHYGVLGPCPRFGYFRCCDRAAAPRQAGGLRHTAGAHHGEQHRRRRPPAATAPVEHGRRRFRGSTTKSDSVAPGDPTRLQETSTVAHQSFTDHAGSAQPLDNFEVPSVPAHRGQPTPLGSPRSVILQKITANNGILASR